MRILILTPGFAASEQDYNCIPPLQLYVRAMQKRGADIQIVAFNYPFRDEEQDWFGVPVISANGQNKPWLHWRSRSRVARYAEQRIQAQKTDIIHSFWLGPAWVMGERLSQKWQIPHWNTLMGQDVRLNNRYLHRLRPDSAGRLIALSDFHAEVLKKNTGFTAGQVIPWGADMAEVPAALPVERPIDILGVGSFIALKNWEKWLKTIALVKTRYPALRAELIGSGAMENRLQREAQQMGLTDTLHFAGNLPRPEVLSRMLRAKVLLHTSDFESFGFVLSEAAMNGCRLVSTPVGIAAQMAQCADRPEELAVLVGNAIHLPLLQQPVIPFNIEKAADVYQRLFLNT